MEPTPLSKIALEIGPLSIRWYGVILGTAALVGLLLAIREGRRRGIHPDLFLDLILFAVPVAIICARAYYVIFEWGYYKEHLEEIVQVWRGGLAIHGALIGSVLTGWLFARYKKISFWGLADIAAPSIIMGQAIGRWGNFINQEAHGGEVSRSFLESLHLPDWIINQMYIDGSYYHPTFLYESLWNLLGFIILLAMRRLNPRRGELFIFYVIWYSIGRFFIEGMRTDSLMLTDSIRIAQLIGVVLIVLMLAIFFYRRKTGLANARYNDSIYLEQEDPKGE